MAISPVKIYATFTISHRTFLQFLSADCRHITTPCITPVTWWILSNAFLIKTEYTHFLLVVSAFTSLYNKISAGLWNRVRGRIGTAVLAIYSNVKARLHGSPRLINTVESTKVNRVSSSFQRKWSRGLTGKQFGDGQISFNVVDSLWVTHHRLPVSTSESRPVPQCRTSRTSFFPLISFF